MSPESDDGERVVDTEPATASSSPIPVRACLLGRYCPTRHDDPMDALEPIDDAGLPLEFGEPGHPLIVVIPDEFGRLPWIAYLADTLASERRVVVPDLFDGVATRHPGTAAGLAEGLDVERSVALLGALIAAERTSGTDGVTVVGFGIGARVALLCASAGLVDDVVAVGRIIPPREWSLVPCPVQLHLTEPDRNADADTFVDHLRDHGTPVSRHDYPGETFWNPHLVEAYDREQWRRCFGLLLDRIADQVPHRPLSRDEG